MSLIDRLQHGDDNTIFHRALAMRGGVAKPDTISEEYPEPSESTEQDAPLHLPEIAPGAAVRALLKELQTQRHFGITTPSHLFSLMNRYLLVETGAILVPHRDGGMVPIATAGLDKTSSFRIRLLEEERSWIGDGRSAVILGEEQRLIFIGRLSRNDAKRAPRVALFPFTHLRDVVAVLVLLDSPVLTMDPGVLDTIVGALSESAGRLLFDGRQRPMDHQHHSSVFQSAHVPAILSRLSERAEVEGRAIQDIDVDLSPLVSTIVDAHPYLDRGRLLDDILNTIAILVGSAHSAVHRGGHRISLLGLAHPDTSEELVVHLLTNTLGQLFGSTCTGALPFTIRDHSKAGEV
ncbi:MAG: hypothetical protein ACLFR8_09005 [Alkalispirochaeta sp.]